MEQPNTGIQQNRALQPDEVARRLMEPQMRYVSRDLLEEWRTLKVRRASLTKVDMDRMRKFWTIGLEITKALHNVGGRLLIGTHTPNPLTVPGYSVHESFSNSFSLE